MNRETICFFLLFLCYNSLSQIQEKDYTTDSLKVLEILSAIAQEHAYSNLEKSVMLSDSAIAIAERIQSVEMQYWCYQWRFGSQRFWIDDLGIQESFKKMQALNLKRNYKDKLDSIGWVYDLNLRYAHHNVNLGRTKLANKLYDELISALEPYSVLDAEIFELIRIAYLSKAKIESYAGNYVEAENLLIYVLDKESEISKVQKREPVILPNLCRLANYQRLQGNLKDARRNYLEGVSHYEVLIQNDEAEKIRQKQYVVPVYLQMFDLFRKISDETTAAKYLKKAEALVPPNDPLYLGIINQEIEYYLERGALDSLEQLLSLKIDLSRKFRYEDLIKYCLNIKSISILTNSFAQHDEIEIFLKSNLDMNDVSHARFILENEILDLKLKKQRNEVSIFSDIKETYKKHTGWLVYTSKVEDKIRTMDKLRELYSLGLRDLYENKEYLESEIFNWLVEGYDQILRSDLIQRPVFDKHSKDERAIRQLNIEISFLKEKLFAINSNNVSKGSMENLRAKIFERSNERDKLVEELNPNRDGLIEIRDLKAELNDTTGLLLYASTDSSLYRYFQFKDEVIFEKLLSDSTMVQNIQNLTSQLKTPKSSKEEVEKIGFMLYNKLVPDQLSSLNNLDLLIKTDGIINSFPFDVLYDGNDYLLSRHNISYPTLIINNSKNEEQSLFMAPSYSVTTDISLAEERSLLVELTHNKNEIEKISKRITGKFFFGKNANLETFINNLDNNKVIHVASHAVINEHNPNYSYLAFANTENKKTKLYQEEIPNYNFSSELVTLSACETGLGEYIKGDGVFSLGRSFLLSGAKSIVSSLWSINDRSTSIVMDNFYQHLASGKDKALSLRLAKIDYMNSVDEEYKHPYYWSSFILIGDTSPIDFKTGIGTSFVLVSIVIVLLLIYGIIRYINSRGLS